MTSSVSSRVNRSHAAPMANVLSLRSRSSTSLAMRAPSPCSISARRFSISGLREKKNESCPMSRGAI